MQNFLIVYNTLLFTYESFSSHQEPPVSFRINLHLKLENLPRPLLPCHHFRKRWGCTLSNFTRVDELCTSLKVFQLESINLSNKWVNANWSILTLTLQIIQISLSICNCLIITHSTAEHYPWHLTSIRKCLIIIISMKQCGCNEATRLSTPQKHKWKKTNMNFVKWQSFPTRCLKTQLSFSFLQLPY